MSVSFSLAGRRAVVTGASRGIGLAMAVALVEAGADVAAVSTGGAVPQQLRAAADRAVVDVSGHAADLSDRDATHRLIDELLARGPVDVLVANAGTIERGPSAQFPEESWDRVLEVNLTSTWLLAQRLGALMAERGSGKIVLTASLLSFQGGLNVAAYTASKHGVAGITKALANEWAGTGVQVNAIAPGYVVTDNTTALRADEKRYAAILDRIPAGRWADPDDIAGACVFLASPASDYISGIVLPVDGGWLGR